MLAAMSIHLKAVILTHGECERWSTGLEDGID